MTVIAEERLFGVILTILGTGAAHVDTLGMRTVSWSFNPNDFDDADVQRWVAHEARVKYVVDALVREGTLGRDGDLVFRALRHPWE